MELSCSPQSRLDVCSCIRISIASRTFLLIPNDRFMYVFTFVEDRSTECLNCLAWDMMPLFMLPVLQSFLEASTRAISDVDLFAPTTQNFINCTSFQLIRSLILNAFLSEFFISTSHNVFFSHNGSKNSNMLI